jgi:hypothetical protein
MSMHTQALSPASVQQRTQRLIQGAIRHLLSEAREPTSAARPFAPRLATPASTASRAAERATSKGVMP